MGVSSRLLFTGLAVALMTLVYNHGERISNVMAICTAKAVAWDGPNALSLVQMSRTLTGWLVTLSGGSFGGEMRSRIFCQSTLYGGCHSTAMREDTARGVGLNHSLKFSPIPEPKASGVNTAALPFFGIFTGRSARKSFRLERNPR